MPCEVIDLPGGGRTIACSRGRGTTKRCRWCGRPAPYLCDFPVLSDKGAGTCDAPMCEDHRHRRGSSIDHCPDHFDKRPEA